MIYLYSGTPGSGKSYHAVVRILELLRLNRNVIANFPLNLKGLKGLRGKFYYIPDESGSLTPKQESAAQKAGEEQGYIYIPGSKMDVAYLCRFALKNHKKGKENQTYIVIDEASHFFNPRDFGRVDRMPWCKFMSLHRHLGFSIILISQHDRLLDRQIRYQIEYDVKHRCVGNFKTLGRVLSLIGIKMFVAVQYWYAVKGERDGMQVFKYKKKIGKLYDSYALFDYDTVSEMADGAAHRRGSGGPAAHGTKPHNDDIDYVNQLVAGRSALIDILKQVSASRQAKELQDLVPQNVPHGGLENIWKALTKQHYFLKKNGSKRRV